VLIELDPVDRITADAVGEPGERTFYIQARGGDRLVTLLVEKQQVQLLAASVVEILSRIGKETEGGPAEEVMGLEEPLVAEWRAGRLSIGYEEERDLLLLEIEELVPEDEPEQEADESAGEEEESAEAEPEPRLSDFPRFSVGEEEDEAAGPEGEDATAAEEASVDRDLARFWATREQMLSLARHGAAVCAAGRPRCPLCGNPLGPEPHRCPALNGHRE
jgi:uncharacterized repeat protein (TIGR03847 family)